MLINKGKKNRKDVVRISFLNRLRNAVILFFLISVGWVVIARFVPVFITPLMYIRSVEAIVAGKSPKNKKEWISIDKMSPNIYQAVCASEDNLFLRHHGFSIEDIQKAVTDNKKGKRIRRGGSTISQQTAKNVFLVPYRSYIRKGFEAYFTVLIELTWTKERIMEVYLNVIEMGDGIYGIEAASQVYFKKSADKLSKSEAALIAACLPNPRRFNAAKPSPYILRRVTKITSLMGKIDRINFDNPKEVKTDSTRQSKKSNASMKKTTKSSRKKTT